jgi:cytosine permease
MTKQSVENMMEDYSLESVPHNMRRPWKEIASIQVGIVTSLAVLMTGGLVTFMSGFWMGMLASFLAFIVSTIFIFFMGTISYREGYSSNIISRAYAFGTRGSALGSIIWGFMIIGFLGLENVLIGNSLLFYLGIEPTTGVKIIMYIVMALFWIVLSLFGVKIVARVAQIMIPLLFLVLLYMVFAMREGSFSEVFSFGIMVPGLELKQGFPIALNATITLAGLLAITATDFTRFLGSRKDVLKVSVTSGVALYGVTILFGAIITFFGYTLTQKYFTDQGMDPIAAINQAIVSPGITLVLAGGFLGLLVVIFSQSKVQVGNSYEGALALVNLFDAIFKWKPGRAVMVVFANIISLIFIFGDILHYLEEFLTLGSVLLGVWVTIVITDYYLVKGKMKRGAQGITSLDDIPAFNFRGIATLIISSALGMAMSNIFPVPFVISILSAFLLYTILSYFILEKDTIIQPEIDMKN